MTALGGLFFWALDVLVWVLHALLVAGWWLVGKAVGWLRRAES